MEDRSTQSSKEVFPGDIGGWQPRDISAMEIHTEYDSGLFIQHLSRLHVLGLALSNSKRLLILALMAEEDRPLCGQEIAERLAVTPQAISHHLQILKNGGLVREGRREHAYRYYILDMASIRQIRETFFADDHLGLLKKGEERQQVLDMFFQGERLVSIPVQRSKRHIVLEELACKFEWGHIYAEAEVNALLKRSYDDVSSLRRYLIDEQIMMSDHGRYWLIRPHDKTT